MTGGTIEWTDRSDWNPIRGCTRKTEACVNCYAEIMAARFSKPRQWGEGYASIVQTPSGPDHRWTGKVELIEERLTIPLKWKKPARCFPNSTSDFFHESLSDADIDRLFAVMISAPHIDFQVLTKRWDRMREYCNDMKGHDARWETAIRSVRTDQGSFALSDAHDRLDDFPPLRNVWLGVSVHDQQSANEAIPALLNTPAAVRFVSYEPALGPVDWERIETNGWNIKSLTGHIYRPYGATFGPCQNIDLIIAGDESGHGKRPADPDWYRQTRDECANADTAFFLKQMHIDGKLVGTPELDGQHHTAMPSAWKGGAA